MQSDAVGNGGSYRGEGGQIGAQRAQIAIVDADADGTRGHGHSRLFDVMHLDDRVRATPRRPG